MRNVPTEGSVEQLLKEYGVSYRSQSRSLVMDCPRCSRKDKLYIRKNDGRFVCWHCVTTDNFQGKPEFALSELTGLRVGEVQARLYGPRLSRNEKYVSLSLKDFEAPASGVDERRDVPPEIIVPANSYPILSPQSAPALEYLETRGIDRDTASRYGLMYCPPMQRIIFLVSDEAGRVVGYQGRDITGNAELKVLSSKGGWRESSLMFYPRLSGSPHAVVFEGPFDALKGHLCGGNVATMGSYISPGQLALIKGLDITRLYIFLDEDALDAVAGVVERSGMECYLCRVPEGRKDPGECTPEEVAHQVSVAKRITRANIHFYLKY